MQKHHNNIPFLVSKSLVIDLIKNDLKNTRLVSGLSELGLDACKYYLTIGDAVFSLMGLEERRRSEKLREEYSEDLSRITEVDIFEYPDKLDLLATVIYMKLVKEVVACEKK
jgi:hypothetical protein